MATQDEMLQSGLKYYCMQCKSCFKEIPTEMYEDGHGGRYITMCKCGCDLICNLVDDKLVEL